MAGQGCQDEALPLGDLSSHPPGQQLEREPGRLPHFFLSTVHAYEMMANKEVGSVTLEYSI